MRVKCVCDVHVCTVDLCVCVCVSGRGALGVSACVCAGGWPVHVPVISFLTLSLRGYKPETR